MVQISSERLIDVEQAANLAARLLVRLAEKGVSGGPNSGLFEQLLLEELMAAAMKPVHVDGVRPLLSIDADDVRAQCPDLDDSQVEAILNSDWSHLVETTAAEVIREQISEKAESLFSEASAFGV